MRDILIVLAAVSLVYSVHGCSIQPGWLGIFVSQLRPTSQKDVIWASFDVHTPEGGPFLRTSQRFALINLETNAINDISCDDPFNDFLPEPSPTEDSSGGYTIAVEWPNANLTSPDGQTEYAFVLETPRGDPITPGEDHNDVVHIFYCPKLDLVYVFYEEIFQRVVTSIIDVSSAGAFTHKIVYAEGLNYLLESPDPLVYKDIQIAAFPGNGADCRGTFFLYYSEEAVTVLHVDFLGDRSDYVRTVGFESQNTTALTEVQSQLWDPSFCFGQDPSSDVCGALRAEDVTITEQSVSHTPNDVRAVSFTQETLKEGLISDLQLCPTSCTENHLPCVTSSDCCSNKCVFSKCRPKPTTNKVSVAGEGRGGQAGKQRPRG